MKFWIILAIVFALSTALAQMEGAPSKRTADAPDLPCEEYDPPENGAVNCTPSAIYGYRCRVECDDGFQFERNPALVYACQLSGDWFVLDIDLNVSSMRWPDCIESTPTPTTTPSSTPSPTPTPTTPTTPSPTSSPDHHQDHHQGHHHGHHQGHSHQHTTLY